MDIATLAFTAYTLAKPFLEKTGEGVARKIGEDIWTTVKKPFTKNRNDDIEELAKNNESEFRLQLEKELNNNPQMAAELKEMVTQAQIMLNGNMRQNINSNDKVEKQINIQYNTGNIEM